MPHRQSWRYGTPDYLIEKCHVALQNIRNHEEALHRNRVENFGFSAGGIRVGEARRRSSHSRHRIGAWRDEACDAPCSPVAIIY